MRLDELAIPGSFPPARRLANRSVVFIPYLLVPVLFGVGAELIDGFATRGSVLSLLVLASFLGIASVGQTLTILIGGVDLAIPAVIGMADVLTTQLYGKGLPFWEVLLVILALAIAVGVFNGIAPQLLRAHPLIITLGTSSMILGGVLVYTHGQFNGTVPNWITTAVSPIGHTGPIPLPGVVIAWAVVTVLIVFFQRRSRLGRQLYALGANSTAARLALVRPIGIWTVAYSASAVFAAITGVLLAGFSGGADANVGQSYLFLTIAAVVVGGTSLLGGRGGYGRTVAGALLITELTTILIGLGYSEMVQEMAFGGLIVLVVAIYGREPHVSRQL